MSNLCTAVIQFSQIRVMVQRKLQSINFKWKDPKAIKNHTSLSPLRVVMMVAMLAAFLMVH